MYKSFAACFLPCTDLQQTNCLYLSSQMCDTTTLLAIQRKTLPIAIARSPRFLPNDINLQASNASNNGNRSSVV